MMSAESVPQQVTILGLGLFGGGAGAARFFAERGAKVIVSDQRDPAELAESVAALKDLPIEYRLGEHRPEDFAGSDLVVINPAVPPDSPAFEMAERSGAPLDTEINLLFRHCPAPIAAVTGTHGKSTAAALLGDMTRLTRRKTWAGGNLGGSLLSDVGRMAPEDIVVLELSSFQTQRLAWIKRSPHLAVVLNLTPNHLDRHKDMAEYAAAKQQILRYQGTEDLAVLNGDDPVVRAWQDIGAAREFVVGFGEHAGRGGHIQAGCVHLLSDDAEARVSLKGLRLPGPHNQFNAAAAATAAWLLGVDTAAIEEAVAKFRGLEDRLQLVAERDGVRFYNDSIATTPEAAIAALNSFAQPVILIAGGSSKNLSFAEAGRAIAQKTKAVVLIGATAGEIEAAVRRAGDRIPPIHHADTLVDAVAKARECARPGDVVLLSPACASFDMFRNYHERGVQFVRLVRNL